MRIAVQLYTLRKVIEDNVEEGFKTLQKLGFHYVELAGFYNLDITHFGQLLNKYQLKPVSSHVSLHEIENNFETVIFKHQHLNIKHIVIPYTDMKDKDSFHLFLPRIKSAVTKLKEKGFLVHYHNHANEFQSFDNAYIIEHLLNEIKDLYLEFDVYWAKYADVDIDAFIQSMHERILYLHAKDYQLDDKNMPYFETVGSGLLDFKHLLNLLPELTYCIIENDQPKNNPFENVKQSLAYLNQITKE